MAEFAGAFSDADSVEILDIYAASEEPIAGVTGASLASAIRGCRARYAASVDEAVAALVREARPGDLLLTLGAGSVSGIAPLLLEALARR